MIILFLIVSFNLYFEWQKEQNRLEQLRFVGEWEVLYSNYRTDTPQEKWTFYENQSLKINNDYSSIINPKIEFSVNQYTNTLTVSSIEVESSDDKSIEWGRYEIKDSKLYIFTSTSFYGYEECYEYNFLNDDTQVDLEYDSYSYYYKTSLTLTKITDEAYTINTIVPWSDINISVINSSYEINWDLIELSRSSVSYTGNTAPIEWGYVAIGDSINFSRFKNDIYVYMKYNRSQNYIGSWSLEVNNIFYVGKNGDYDSIQSAINYASAGDTIYVFNGTYYENILVNKPLRLIGENKENTIIYAGSDSNAIFVTRDEVSISGFTLRTTEVSDDFYPLPTGIIIITNNVIFSDNIVTGEQFAFGINVQGTNNVIANNIVKNIKQDGIVLVDRCVGNNVYNNHIEDCTYYAIFLEDAKKNKIYNNTLTKCGEGIHIRGTSNENEIYQNQIIKNNRYGIYFEYFVLFGSAENNKIFMNQIENNGDVGIYMKNISNNVFYCNNFVSQTIDVYSNKKNTFYNNITLMGNYWDILEHRIVNIESHNGVWDTPFEIWGGVNQDPYPLTEPYPIPNI